MYDDVEIGEWLSILKLAHKWEMSTIFNFGIDAIRQLPLDAVDRVVVCQRYNMGREWGRKAYMDICTRPKPLGVAEAMVLGWEMSIAIAGVREHLMRTQCLSSPKEKIQTPRNVDALDQIMLPVTNLGTPQSDH